MSNKRKQHDYSKDRSNKWVFIIYKDSMPEDYLQILKDTHIPMAISPLHKPDNEDKKEHYHIIVDYGKGQNKSQTQVNMSICQLVNGTLPFIADSPIGTYEYLIHLNDPEKEQFENGFDAITHINGFEKEAYIRLGLDYMNRITIDIIGIIEQENITEFAELVRYCVGNDIDKLSYIKKDSYFYNSYMRSRKVLYREKV